MAFRGRCFLALAALSLSTPAAVSSAQVEITTCGQAVFGQSATLMADLDCSGSSAPGIEAGGASIELNGHTITGGTHGISCDGKCSVEGPGTITGADQNGVHGFNSSGKPRLAKLRISEVTASGNGASESIFSEV